MVVVAVGAVHMPLSDHGDGHRATTGRGRSGRSWGVGVAVLVAMPMVVGRVVRMAVVVTMVMVVPMVMVLPMSMSMPPMAVPAAMPCGIGAALGFKGQVLRFHDEVHGAQQRRIGAGEHGVAILAVLGEDTDADACRDRQRLAGNGEGHGDGIENALGEGEGVALVAEVGHHEAEFVAAQPADGIAFPHLQLQATTHFDQDLVADRRAERVVEHPETIEVEQDQRRAPLEAAGGEQCLVEAVGEQGGRDQVAGGRVKLEVRIGDRRSGVEAKVEAGNADFAAVVGAVSGVQAGLGADEAERVRGPDAGGEGAAGVGVKAARDVERQ